MSSSSRRVLACAMLLFLQSAHCFLSHESVRLPQKQTTSPSQLSMAWTLPNQPSFQPSWYQDCGNPTARRVVYDDSFDLEDDDDEFYVANFGSDWSAPSTYDVVDEPEALPRGARIRRVARRAFQGIRNTFNP